MAALARLIFTTVMTIFCLQSETLAIEAKFKNVQDQTEIYYLNPYRERHYFGSYSQILADWSWIRSESASASTLLEIPAETGRGVTIPKKYSDKKTVFLKGTGLNPEWAGENNAIRYSTDGSKALGFDGQFRLIEGLTDIINSEILHSLDVPVARPLGMIAFKERPDHELTRGIYAREFVSQTRISNLYAISLDEAKNEINNAIQSLQAVKKLDQNADLESYFFYMLDEMSRTAAIFQNTGFWHRVLHYQQFTLAGEITDLGTGVWLGDVFDAETLHSKTQEYFKFENQPILILNMLMRTHAVTAENPTRLQPTSETLLLNKKSLLGVIQKIDPEIYQRIIDKEPESYFWSRFIHHSQEIDSKKFQNQFKPSNFYVLKTEITDWLKKIDPEISETQLVQKKNDILNLFETEKARYLPATFLVTKIPSLKKHQIKIRTEGLGILKKMQNSFQTLEFQLPKLKLDPFTQQNFLWKEYSISTEGYEVPSVSDDFFTGTRFNSAPIQQSGSVPKKIWNLNINTSHPEVLSWIDQFKDQIKHIQQSDPSLTKPESIFQIQKLIYEYSELSYGPGIKNEAYRQIYLSWKNRRYSKFGSVKLSELLTMRIGECHDTALLSYILGLEVQKIQPNYRFSILGSYYGSENSKKHYFVVMTAPNNRSYVIDPIVSKNEATLPLNRAFDKKIIRTHDFYKKLNWIVDNRLAEQPASIQSQCADWLKKLFILFPLKPGVF